MARASGAGWDAGLKRHRRFLIPYIMQFLSVNLPECDDDIDDDDDDDEYFAI